MPGTQSNINAVSMHDQENAFEGVFFYRLNAVSAGGIMKRCLGSIMHAGTILCLLQNGRQIVVCSKSARESLCYIILFKSPER